MDHQVEEISTIEQALEGNREAFSQLIHNYAGGGVWPGVSHAGQPTGCRGCEPGNLPSCLYASGTLRSYAPVFNLVAFDWISYCVDRLRRQRYSWPDALDDVALVIPQHAAWARR